MNGTQVPSKLILSIHDLDLGDQIVVVIKHKDDCPTPKVLNPEVLNPKSTFKIASISVSSAGLLLDRYRRSWCIHLCC